MEADRSIVVFGAGAVGCYLGAKLARSPRLQITLVGRPAVVEAVQSNGLILREGASVAVTHPRATTSAAGLPPPDLILLTVRAYDVEVAAESLRDLVGKMGLLLAMQNGVGSEERLAARFGRERVLAGTLTIRADLEKPGVVTPSSARGGVAIASMDGERPPAWVLEALRSTGLPVVVVDDYRSLRWSKLLLNMLGAATSAILDVDMPAIVGNRSLFRLEQLAFREALRVMKAQGVRVVALPGYPVPLVRAAMSLPRPLAQRLLAPRLAGARGGRSPTMRADMARGRSEIAFFNGAVADEAARLGIPAPVNAALADLIQDLIRRPERRAHFQGQPRRLLAYMKERGVIV